MLYTDELQMLRGVWLLFALAIVISLLLSINSNISLKGYTNSRSIGYQQAYLKNASAININDGSPDSGFMNFTKAENLSNNTNDSVYGQVATSGKTLYVIWEESVYTPSLTMNANSNESNYDIFIKKSIDGGKSFSKLISLNKNSSNISGGVNDNSSNQEIAAYGNNVYVVWQQGHQQQGKPIDNNNTNGYSRIVFRSSSDAGSTFENAKILTNNATAQSYPKVAATYSGNHNIVAYVVWTVVEPMEPKFRIDEGIFFTKSTDNGNSFSNITKINGKEWSIGEAQVAAYRNNVYVVWAGIPDLKIVGDIFFTKSTDNGNSFLTNPVSLGERNSLNVEVAAHENNVYVSWQGVLITSDNKMNEEIFIKRSRDYGDTLIRAAAQNISNNAGVSECTSIALAGSTAIYVVWEDNTLSNHEILFSRNNATVRSGLI